MEYKKLPKDIAKQFQDAGKEENLTRSPDVNNLIRIAQALKQGKAKPELLQEQLGILYQLHKNMADTVEFLSKTQPKTDVSNERLPMIEEGLARFKEALDELNFYLEDGNLQHIEIGIDLLIEETNSLFASADILKKDEEKIQIFSDSPMISELIRIGKGVAEGLYDPGNLKKRLAFCKTFHQSAYENIKEVMDDAYDTREAEEEAPLIMEALDLMEDGFDEIEMYFEDNDPEHILEGTELVRQAAEELSSSYNILVSAVEEADKEAEQDTVPKEKICFKCGLKAQPDIKICPKCHIPIPDIKPIEEHPVEEPTVRIDVGEAKDMVTPMMTPNVKKDL